MVAIEQNDANAWIADACRWLANQGVRGRSSSRVPSRSTSVASASSGGLRNGWRRSLRPALDERDGTRGRRDRSAGRAALTLLRDAGRPRARALPRRRARTAAAALSGRSGAV